MFVKVVDVNVTVYDLGPLTGGGGGVRKVRRKSPLKEAPFQKTTIHTYVPVTK